VGLGVAAADEYREARTGLRAAAEGIGVIEPGGQKLPEPGELCPLAGLPPPDDLNLGWHRVVPDY
jgi:hypothetical protein